MCDFKFCVSGRRGTIAVNEIIGDGSWRTMICKVCARVTGLEEGDTIPFDAGEVNRKLVAAAENRSKWLWRRR